MREVAALVDVADGSTPDDMQRAVHVLRRIAARVLAQESSPLTFRETGVLSLAAEGMTSSAIARELGIAENTVKNHLRNVNKKLGVCSRAHAVSVAVRAGWLGAPDRGL